MSKLANSFKHQEDVHFKILTHFYTSKKTDHFCFRHSKHTNVSKTFFDKHNKIMFLYIRYK